MAGIVAKNYCDAIFSVAQEDNTLDLFKEQLLLVDDTLKDDQFRFVMSHPKISHDEKKQLLENVYNNVLDHTLLNFLKLLVDKGRFIRIHEIVKEFIKQYNDVNQIQVVYVSSAKALCEEEVQRLKVALEKKLHKHIDMRQRIDEDLMAGVRVKINDQVIDNSAKARLQQLRKHIEESDVLD